MKKVKSVVPFIIASVFMMVLCLIRLQISTYADMINNGSSYFFMSFIPLFVAYLFFLLHNATKRSEEEYSMLQWLLIFSMLIQTASLVSLPLLEYSSGNSNATVTRMAQKCFLQTVVFAVSVLVAYFVMKFLPKMIARSKKLVLTIFIVIGAIAGISLICAKYLKLQRAATTDIMGIQVGTPLLAFLVIYSSVLICLFFSDTKFSKNKKKTIIWGFLGFGGIILLVSGYIICSEYGLIAFLAASIAVWLICFHSNQNKGVFWTVLIGSILLVGVVIVYYKVLYEKMNIVEESDFGYLAQKIGRMFVDESNEDAYYQTQAALESIKFSGPFGSNVYKLVPMAISDFSVATSIHYIGWIWFLFIIFSLTMTVINGCKFWGKQINESSGLKSAANLCLIIIALISFYNFLANLGVVGIIGVSSYASGYGFTNYAFSGFVLGVILYPCDKLVIPADVPKSEKRSAKKDKKLKNKKSSKI